MSNVRRRNANPGPLETTTRLSGHDCDGLGKPGLGAQIPRQSALASSGELACVRVCNRNAPALVPPHCVAHGVGEQSEGTHTHRSLSRRRAPW